MLFDIRPFVSHKSFFHTDYWFIKRWIWCYYSSSW